MTANGDDTLLMRKLYSLFNRLSHRIIIGLSGLILLAFVWGSVFVLIDRDHQTTVEGVHRENSNLAKAFEENVRRILITSDIQLRAIKDEYEQKNEVTPALQVMINQFSLDPAIVQARLVDAKGNNILSMLPSAVNVSERDYFTAQRETNNIGMFIDKPVLGFAYHKWVIFLSRRLNNPDGSFKGIVSVSLSTDYFAKFYKQMELGEGKSIALTGLDGIMRVRLENSDLQAGLDVREGELYHRARQKSSDSVLVTLSSNRQQYFISYRVLPDYPLYVAVGVQKDQALAAYNRRSLIYVMGAMLFSLVIVICGYIIIRQRERELRSEKAQQVSNEKYTKIYAVSPDAILVTRVSDGLFLDVNWGFSKLFGYTRKETIGKTTFELGIWANSEDRQAWTDLLEKNGEVIQHEVEFRMKDGSLRTCVISANLLDMDGEKCILSITRDMTERKLMEKELRRLNEGLEKEVGARTQELTTANEELIVLNEESTAMNEEIATLNVKLTKTNEELESRVAERTAELTASHEELTSQFDELTQVQKKLLTSEEMLSKVFQTSSTAFTVARQEDGYFYNVNESFCKIIGYEMGEVIGKSAAELHLWVNPAERLKIVELLKKQGSITRTEVELRRKDGSIRLCEFSWRSIEISGVQCLIAALIDITERKQTEYELAEYRTNLEALVAKRTEELQYANKELEAFSYSVSHDLRAPLRAINGFSANLIESLGERLNVTEQDELKRIINNAEKMSNLIDDLLKLSRIGRTQMMMHQVNLSKLVEDCIAECKASELGRNVSVIVEPNLSAQGDSQLLKIFFVNLISNAWKYTSKNADARVEFGSTLIDGKTVYYMRDNGAGFDMQYVDKLFAPFQRLHRASEFPGTGIGLALMARIIQRHEGKIWAEGKVGQGATFFFTLGG